ncbi:DEAD/DEAH box helicase [Falsiruegeria mediterranea]|uniref:RNA polymerase-associated protein RapA n=1 Tax=Falsiruegeria mediterranea M17 TaxID=1200281 RepID=A0A2R8CAF6_9RHOB|nr:DEAD/DEAH box helicase [Falsiruegeria mediterranea]SPJ29419.1 RNA polymerase-associated protein RapA [Falsiruegeria mediterranea M17]
MSDSCPVAKVSEDGVEISFPKEKRGFLNRFLSSRDDTNSFLHLPDDQRDLLFAIADLRNWGDLHENEVQIENDFLRISHNAAANLSSNAAQTLGLPVDVDLTLKTDVTGVLGHPDFRLHYEWHRQGQREMPRRTGAFLETARGIRRIPLWMKRALDLADGFDPNRPLEEHWSALAEFRRALEPDEIIPDSLPENQRMAGLAMTAFLRGLQVRIANRFSISPDRTLGHFDIIPYSSDSLENNAISEDDISESDAELEGEPLAAFQYRVQAIGVRPAYQLGNNSYLVIDRSSTPVLEEMVRVQNSDRNERKAFIENPRTFITEAVSRHLKENGALDDLDEAEQQEVIEATAGPAFIESVEYSERVTGVVIYEKPTGDREGSGTAWLPEVFPEHIVDAIAEMPTADLKTLRDRMAASLETSNQPIAAIAGQEVEVTAARLSAVSGELNRREAEDSDQEISSDIEGEEDLHPGPIILDTLDNFEELSWHAKLHPRHSALPISIPETITTKLRQHQIESFNWAAQAWSSGLPGILNADEQGLGKTLQSIAFLNWLQAHMQSSDAEDRGPILIVAPTSLLRNWEEEVERHVAPRKFGHLVRLYGSSLSGHKQSGAQGTETGSGIPLLDFEWLTEAIEEARAHRYWFLTTYTTLANYQHSLGRIRFSALVMDEIQNIKNKDTIASKAAEAMNADFRIGLTGTPIENSAMDLWTIMDRIAPGALGSGTDFKSRYRDPDESNMAELHDRVFKGHGGHPPLGLRRLKDEVARDLPAKQRLLHPRIMPKVQSQVYDEAREKLAEGSRGAALKMLHHIRSVSVHPGLAKTVHPEDFVKMSARLSATMDILKGIAGRGEKVLVFIEHREMQFRFAELVRHFFGLEQIDIINGDTPIPKRQAIVNRFQSNLDHDTGFDLLVLGPKAAGTGLTLTAATHVIHLSRWWNPAVEEQCNDRIHRIGQTHPVEVHVPLAIHPEYGEHSFDCLLQSLMQKKRKLASQALWPMGDTRGDLSGLQSGLEALRDARTGNVISTSMQAMFQRDGLSQPTQNEQGAYLML